MLRVQIGDGLNEMKTTYIDHVVVTIPAELVKTTLDRFSNAGFQIYDSNFIRPDGTASSFITMNGSYIELSWVSDVALFEVMSDAFAKDCYLDEKPIAVCARVHDARAAHQAISLSGLTVPEPVDHWAPIGGKMLPAWRVLTPKLSDTPGARLHLVQYLLPRNAERFFVQSENGVSGLTGVTLLSPRPEDDGEAWRSILYPVFTEKLRCAGRCIELSDQRLTWESSGPEQGEQHLVSQDSRKTARITSIELACDKFDLTRAWLEAANFTCIERNAISGKYKLEGLSGLVIGVRQVNQ
ncbi:VOC family protein [Agrobacterium sp. 22-226-1]